MQALFLTLAILASGQNTPVVEQRVECISVAHIDDGAELVFFWGLVQHDWTCLDHRWIASDMAVSRYQDGWRLGWTDDAYNCYRLVSTGCWVESWESESPLAPINRRPWFRKLLNPGLKQPPRRAAR